MIKRFLGTSEGQQLDWVLNSAADGMLIVDQEGRIILANPALQRMFGYSPAELVDSPIEILLPEQNRHGHAAHRAAYFERPSERAMGSGLELFGRHRDGTKFPVEVSLSPLQTAKGYPLVMATVHDITQRKQAEQALHKSQAELRLLGGYLERIKEEERKRIAREIHDELGGLLAGIKANVSVYIERAARAGNSPEPLLVDALALADTGFQAVRRVITDLRPSVLDQLGVWAALEWHAGQVEKRSGLPCTCMIDASAVATEPGLDVSTMLFRVVQEALTNVVRHAAASTMSIHATILDRTLIVIVKDDGKGIDSTRQPNRESWGIEGMGERVRYFGGELIITGRVGEGTTVELRLPTEKMNDE